MYRKRLLYAQLAVVAALTLLHHTGLGLDLYWRFLWLDTLSHTLGGIWAALFIFWALSFWERAPRFIWGVAAALAVGVFWEVFEIAVGPRPEANYAFDTSIDLLMDAIGGAMGTLCAFYFAKNSSDAPKTVLPR